METRPVPGDDRPGWWRSSALWATVLFVGLTAGGVAAWTATNRIIQAGQRSRALAERYAAWSGALIQFTPTDPARKRYVGQLAIYYDVLARKYRKASFQPWFEVGPDLVAPERPEELAGSIDPATGIPPEVAEALGSPNASVGGDPITGFSLWRP